MLNQAFALLLEEENINIPAWLSFNSKDGVNVVSGDSLSDCASIAESSNKIVAVGINCTPPRFIRDLILSMKKVRFGFCFITTFSYYIGFFIYRDANESMMDNWMRLIPFSVNEHKEHFKGFYFITPSFVK